jgi:quercetin dioxygenase-like cupin family protein
MKTDIQTFLTNRIVLNGGTIMNEINPLNSADEEVETWQYKRIVVEVNAEGKSYTATDKVSKVIMDPGHFELATLWCTKELPADNNVVGDLALELKTLLPFPKGTVAKELVLYPDSPGMDKHPESKTVMHKHDTLDYISILKGEMWLVTETAELLVKTGDAIVIKGVNHAWSNRSKYPCVSFSVMVDAMPYAPFEMNKITVDTDKLPPGDPVKTWKYKRIVVGSNAEGKSCILTDQASSAIMNASQFHRADHWCTAEFPADNSLDRDRALEQKKRQPYPSGTLFRDLIIFTDNHDVEKFTAMVKALHQKVQQTYMPTEEDYKRHPNMHRTDSVDIISIAEGEVYMMTDLDDILMVPGDLVIIRGGNHSWSNRSSKPCVMDGVMLDAIPRKEFHTGK